MNNPVEDVKRICLHEAGHHVIARTLGFESAYCEIKLEWLHVGGGFSDVRLARNLPSKDDVVLFLKDRVKVLYAGALAQSLTATGIDNAAANNAVKKPDAKHDYDLARELIRVLGNIQDDLSCFPEDEVNRRLGDISGELWEFVHGEVLKERKPIEEIGSKLADRALSNGFAYKLPVEDINKLPSVSKRFL